MSAQGSIYVSTARNARHFNRVELMQMVDEETDFREDVKMRIVEDMQNNLDFESFGNPLADECFDYTKLYVGIDRQGVWTNFKAAFHQEVYHFEPYYDPWEEYCPVIDSIYDMWN